MVNIDTVRKLALTFPETDEHDHWGRPSFRVKKKIFLTLWPTENQAVLKLSRIDQSVFMEYNSSVFYPVDNKWGGQGWTCVNLKKVRKDMFKDALQLAWKEVAPKSLVNTKNQL